jgi:hypothetical protein
MEQAVKAQNAVFPDFFSESNLRMIVAFAPVFMRLKPAARCCSGIDLCHSIPPGKGRDSKMIKKLRPTARRRTVRFSKGEMIRIERVMVMCDRHWKKGQGAIFARVFLRRIVSDVLKGEYLVGFSAAEVARISKAMMICDSRWKKDDVGIWVRQMLLGDVSSILKDDRKSRTPGARLSQRLRYFNEPFIED